MILLALALLLSVNKVICTFYAPSINALSIRGAWTWRLDRLYPYITILLLGQAWLQELKSLSIRRVPLHRFWSQAVM